MNVLFDAFDRVVVRLPNRPVLELHGLSVAQASRLHRLLHDGAMSRALCEVIPMVLPYKWGAFWQTRRDRKTLKRLRNAEVARVLERILVGNTTIQSDTPDTSDDPPPSFDDIMAEYVKVFGMPRSSDPWLLMLRCLERAGMLEARDLVRAFDAQIAGAVSTNGDKDSRRRVATLHKWLRRQAYPKSAASDA